MFETATPWCVPAAVVGLMVLDKTGEGVELPELELKLWVFVVDADVTDVVRGWRVGSGFDVVGAPNDRNTTCVRSVGYRCFFFMPIFNSMKPAVVGWLVIFWKTDEDVEPLELVIKLCGVVGADVVGTGKKGNTNRKFGKFQIGRLN